MLPELMQFSLTAIPLIAFGFLVYFALSSKTIWEAIGCAILVILINGMLLLLVSKGQAGLAQGLGPGMIAFTIVIYAVKRFVLFLTRKIRGERPAQ